MENIRQLLQKQSKAWLIDRLVELSVVDDANENRIMLSLVAEHDNERTIVSKFRRCLDKAAKEIETNGAGTWNQPLSYEAFGSVADALATIVISKNH